MPKTYNELFITARQALRDAGIEACSLEARLLVACAAEKTSEELTRDLQLYSSDEIEARLLELTARRLAGEPAAYVTGGWGFYGLDLKITPDVLIPRTDTETLVAAALEKLRGREEEARILDLCTGSGCVAFALLSALPRARAVLLDNSLDALAVAAENAERLGLAERAECVAGDVKAPADMTLGSFDLIVSNPPYVRSGEISRLDGSVKDYEPLSALDGGADGLDFYRAILENDLCLLRRSGWLLFEVGEDQAADVALLMRRAGLRSIGTEQDTAGYERVVFGRL